VTDAQAMQESADSMFPAFLAGANFIQQAAGWLEGGLVVGYEKFILDSDRLGMLHRMGDGMAINENSLGFSAYMENSPGENFLGTEHTGENYETANFRSEIADNNSFEQWEEDGSKDAEERAYERWNTMLDEYIEPPMIGYLTVIPALFLSGMMLGALGMFLSSAIKQLENFAGVMNFVIFPMFFASSALYPLWKIRESSEILFYFCSYNPFTHAVELIRFSLYGQLNEKSLIFVFIFLLIFLMLAIYGYDPSKGFISKKKV